ncbi:MAG: ABC transporter permease [Gammaproteobacteria bacterium]|nr:ABC transporter permease [Gammaproteobacteria bacterium]
MTDTSKELPVILIESTRSWGFVDFAELSHYRDLLYLMVWRTVKVAYAQSVGGLAWALIQPAIQILVFTLIFGNLVNVGSDGLPYLLFSTVAIVPWSYMSSTMMGSSGSLVANAGMLGKIYIPRIIYPMLPVLSGLITFGISLILVIAALLYYQVVPTKSLLLLPLLFLMMMMVPLAFGLWLSSLAIRYRDVGIAMGYFMRMLIYTAPILYPSTKVPDDMRWWYVLNPVVGVIEGFRSALLGASPDMFIRWDSLISGFVVLVVMLISGSFYFRRMERIVVDVI